MVALKVHSVLIKAHLKAVLLHLPLLYISRHPNSDKLLIFVKQWHNKGIQPLWTDC